MPEEEPSEHPDSSELALLPEQSKTKEPPACPHKDIITLYHECLPGHPRVREWNEENQKRLRARWREEPERQSLDWWRNFFVSEVAASDFLTGRAKEFQATMEWMVRPRNFSKILNGQYRNRGPRTGSRLTDGNMRVAQEWAEGN